MLIPIDISLICFTWLLRCLSDCIKAEVEAFILNQENCSIHMNNGNAYKFGTPVRMSAPNKSIQHRASKAAMKCVLVMSIVHKDMITVSWTHPVSWQHIQCMCPHLPYPSILSQCSCSQLPAVPLGANVNKSSKRGSNGNNQPSKQTNE